MKSILSLIAVFSFTAFAEESFNLTPLDPSRVECVWEDNFAITVDKTAVFESSENQLDLMARCSRAVLAASLNAATLQLNLETGEVISDSGYVVGAKPESLNCELTVAEGFLLRIDGFLGGIVNGADRVSKYFACVNAVSDAQGDPESGVEARTVVIDLEAMNFQLQ